MTAVEFSTRRQGRDDHSGEQCSGCGLGLQLDWRLRESKSSHQQQLHSILLSIPYLYTFTCTLMQTSCMDYSVAMSAVTKYTSSMILTNVGRMVDQQIRNEAELRFCIGDPIICSICDAWRYKAKLEECEKSDFTTRTFSCFIIRTPTCFNFKNTKGCNYSSE